MTGSIHEDARRALDEAAALRRRSQAAIDAAQATLGELDRTGMEHEQVAALEAEVAGLRKAMESRATIEQAKGIIIATSGCSPDEAFALLVRQSQHENRRLRTVAEDLVTSKVRALRAQAAPPRPS